MKEIEKRWRKGSNGKCQNLKKVFPSYSPPLTARKSRDGKDDEVTSKRTTIEFLFQSIQNLEADFECKNAYVVKHP